MSTIAADDHAFEPHDHRRCVRAAMDHAVRICRDRKGRLTQQRQRVLELIWNSHRPVGAYFILEQLRAEGYNGAPPTVYRALEFLLAFDLIHRIESLNAYIGCTHPGAEHSSQFLICSSCQSVAELDDVRINHAIINSTARIGFVAAHPVIEINGLCPECQECNHA